MSLIADALLISGAFAAAIYCWVLSRRLRGLENMDKGVGGAIASLNEQVGEMKIALRATQSVTGESVSNLQMSTKKAEKVARRLEDYLSELDDLGVTAPIHKPADEDPVETKHANTKSKDGSDTSTSQPADLMTQPNAVEFESLTHKKSDSDANAGLSLNADKQQADKQQVDEPKRAKRVDVRAPSVQPNADLGIGTQKTENPRSDAVAFRHQHPASGLASDTKQKRAELQKEKSKLIAESGLSVSEIEADEALIKARAATGANISALADRRLRKPLEQNINVDTPVSSSAAERLQQDIKHRLESRIEGSDEDEFVKALQTVLAATTK